MNGNTSLDLDLDIDNYQLQDLLNLFKLEYNFSSNDLKQAKKIVMKIHPDKSHLPDKYFLFFCKAFNIIHSIHQFRNAGSKERSTQYVTDYDNDDESREKLLKKIANKSNFNKIFNELFEKYRIMNEEDKGGYGDWLSSNDDIDNSVVSKNNMHAAFEEKKVKARSLIIKSDISEMGNEGYGLSELVGAVPDSYGSAVFSRFGYEDLRKAHVETVVPVTQDDLNSRPSFSNEQELRHYREVQNNKPMSLSESKQYLKLKQNNDDKNDVIRAFKLAKQDEKAKLANENWLNGFKQIGC